MSKLVMALFDGGGKFLYQTSLGVKDDEDGDGQVADFSTISTGSKCTELRWNDGEGKSHLHRHDHGAFGYAVLRERVLMNRSGNASK